MDRVCRVVVALVVVGLAGALVVEEAHADDHPDEDRVITADRTAGEAERTDSVYRTRFGQRTERGPRSPYHQIHDSQGFFRVAPVLGAPGLHGDVTVNDRRVDVDANPADNLGNYDLVAGVGFEVGYRNTGLLADFRHLDATTDEIDVADGDGSLNLEHFISNVALHRAFTPLEILEIGPVAGVRHVWVRTGHDNAEEIGASDQWFDPILGFRGQVGFTDAIYLEYYGDVGGIGYGSEITWQAYGGVGVSVGDTDFELGYRALYAEYENELEYDILQAGPTLTTRFNF